MTDTTRFTRFAAALGRVPVPPEDRGLSPFTGLTRDHWVAVADDLLLSAARFRTPEGARLDLPGRPSQQGIPTDGLEGFARTFLLAAFVTAGNGGEDPHGHLDRYREGLVAGTRSIGRDDPDSWPAIGHIGRDGQPHVEAASIALSLSLTREWIWDGLGDADRDRIAAWLRAAIDREPSSNNWYLFPFTIASFLESVGRADEQTSYVIARGLALIDTWYRGEGWYSDGEGEAFDHYIGWALHFYPLWHARLIRDEQLERRLGDRLEEFLGSFARTFDRNGAPTYIGRSMTYRMATLAAVAMGEVIGRTPLTPGQSRRILSADLRYFLEREATEDGILTLGWHGPHEPTLQRYSGPGSPYWTSKGFAALLLPATHQVWTAQEEPLPGDDADHVRAIGPAGLLIQATAADGISRTHNHGSDHVKPFEADAGAPNPLYARFAYSTRTGPTALHNPSDNDLQLQVRGAWSVRRRIHAVAAGEDWVASWHVPRFTVYGPFDASDDASNGPVLPSSRVESVTAARGGAEVRIHRLVGIPPLTPVRLSGWAVAADELDGLTTSVDGRRVLVSSDERNITGEVLHSQLLGVVGWSGGSTSRAPYGTAYGRLAVMPELSATSALGVYAPTLLVALAALDGTDTPTDLDAVSVSVSGPVVTIAWPQGEPTVIDLDGIPWPRMR